MNKYIITDYRVKVNSTKLQTDASRSDLNSALTPHLHLVLPYSPLRGVPGGLPAQAAREEP